MPTQGTQFHLYPDMGRDQSAALRFGINLFQLVWPRSLKINDKRIHGVFNVKVEEEESDNPNVVKPRFRATWYCDGRSYITFDRGADRRLAVAWMPDDPWWHNRIILMDQPNIFNMLTQFRKADNSILDAQDVKMELDCLSKVMKSPRQIFNIFENGKQVGSYRIRKEAEEFIEDATTVAPKVMKDGTLMAPKRMKTSWEIRESIELAYKPEIEEMIKKEFGRYEHGWTEGKYFREEIRPKVVAMINEEREKSVAEPKTTGNIFSQISQMSASERAKLREMLLSKEVSPLNAPKNPLRESVN